MINSVTKLLSPQRTSSAPPAPAASQSGVSFQKAVSAWLERRYPSALAGDDNVGLTIGSLHDVERGSTASVMLCVDLTEQILQEALAQRTDFIVVYSPLVKQPLRALSTEDVTGRILLTCAQHSLAVYSIFTACDRATRGMTHWLASSLAAGQVRPIVPHPELPEAGHGRLLECDASAPLSAIVQRLKKLLGLRYVRLALGAVVDEHNLLRAQEFCFVKKIAVQVGDGASALLHCEPDVLVCSEMTHADILAASAQGVVLILTGQSTIERAFLGQLRQELQDDFADSDWNVKVKCSQVDTNPLSLV